MAPGTQVGALRSALLELTALPFANLPNSQNLSRKEQVNSSRETPGELLSEALQSSAIVPTPNTAAKGQCLLSGGAALGFSSTTLPPIRATQGGHLGKPDDLACGSQNLPNTPQLLLRAPPNLPAVAQEERQSQKPFLRKREKSAITFYDCQRLFHLPVDKAAKQLGVSRPTIARVMRASGIKRWPYRAIRARRLSMSIDTPVQIPIVRLRRTTATEPNPRTIAPRVSEPSYISIHGANTDTVRNLQSTLMSLSPARLNRGRSVLSSNGETDGAFENKSNTPGAPFPVLGATEMPNSIDLVPGKQGLQNMDATHVDRRPAGRRARRFKIVHLTKQNFPPTLKTASPSTNKQLPSKPTSLSLWDCQRPFHLPIDKAVGNLRMSGPASAKMMRTRAIKRWSFRIRKPPSARCRTLPPSPQACFCGRQTHISSDEQRTQFQISAFEKEDFIPCRFWSVSEIGFEQRK